MYASYLGYMYYNYECMRTGRVHRGLEPERGGAIEGAVTSSTVVAESAGCVSSAEPLVSLPGGSDCSVRNGSWQSQPGPRSMAKPMSPETRSHPKQGRQEWWCARGLETREGWRNRRSSDLVDRRSRVRWVYVDCRTASQPPRRERL
jgi:hypothetical protein